jgi:hypothetical protein
MKHFGNYGKSVHIKVLDYTFELFMLNYAPVSPLPGATVENKFEMKLRMRYDSEHIILVGRDAGGLASKDYIVELGIPHLSLTRYGIAISNRNIEVDSACVDFFAELAPVSSLL